MVIPMNFVIGAALGALVTYVAKDESSKRWLNKTGTQLKEGANSFTESFSKAETESADKSASDAMDSAKAVEDDQVEIIQNVQGDVIQKTPATP